MIANTCASSAACTTLADAVAMPDVAEAVDAVAVAVPPSRATCCSALTPGALASVCTTRSPFVTRWLLKFATVAAGPVAS